MLEIWSPHFHRGRLSPIRLVVIHDMEAKELLDTAEAIARYFRDTPKEVSAHICADADSRVRCVKDVDTAFAAPGANHDGLQIELAGFANQGAAGWADAYSQVLLREQAAPQVREWCRMWGIPMRKLTDAQLADGTSKGIVGHDQVSRVFKRSTHTDPGPAFPWSQFLAMVQDNEEEDPLAQFTEEQLRSIVNSEVTDVLRVATRGDATLPAGGYFKPLGTNVAAIKAVVGQLTDDEANILAAIAGIQAGEPITPEQLGELRDALVAALPGYTVSITPQEVPV